MRVRRLLVSALVVGLTLGVGAPVVSAATASATESCAYVLERYQLTYANFVRYTALAVDLRKQAETATGSRRTELLAQASAAQKSADDNRRWSDARREQLKTQCGIIIVIPNIRMAYSG